MYGIQMSNSARANVERTRRPRRAKVTNYHFFNLCRHFLSGAWCVFPSHELSNFRNKSEIRKIICRISTIYFDFDGKTSIAFENSTVLLTWFNQKTIIPFGCIHIQITRNYDSIMRIGLAVFFSLLLLYLRFLRPGEYWFNDHGFSRFL